MRMWERQLTEVIKDNYRIIPIILTINMISVYKFCVIGGIFLTWFADSMLFSMMVKTEFTDGVETHQDLIDRDMSLGILESWSKLKSVNKLIFSYLGSSAVASERYETLRLRSLQNTRNDDEMFLLFIFH